MNDQPTSSTGATTGEHDGSEREYTKSILDFARDVDKQIYIRVTAAIGVAVLYLTQLPFERLAALSVVWKGLLLGGLVAMLAAAGCFFRYQSIIHKEIPNIAGLLRKPVDPQRGDAGKQFETAASGAARHT